MLSSKAQKAITGGYSKRKRKSPKVWYQIEDPDNDKKVLKFPPRLKCFIETIGRPCEKHYTVHRDRFTDFEWLYKIQRTSPGNFCIDRGLTMIAHTLVEEASRTDTGSF